MPTIIKGLYEARLVLTGKTPADAGDIRKGELTFERRSPPGAVINVKYPAELIPIESFGALLTKYRGNETKSALSLRTGVAQSIISDVENGNSHTSLEHSNTLYTALGGDALYLAILDPAGRPADPSVLISSPRQPNYADAIRLYFYRERRNRQISLSDVAVRMPKGIRYSSAYDYERSTSKTPRPLLLKNYFNAIGLAVAFCGIRPLPGKPAT